MWASGGSTSCVEAVRGSGGLGEGVGAAIVSNTYAGLDGHETQGLEFFWAALSS